MNTVDIHLLEKTKIFTINTENTRYKVLKLLKKKREKILAENINQAITSKFRIDSLNKRVKAKFFKMLHKTLCCFINIKLYKIPQKIITNVGIHYNKLLLKETVSSLYQKNV